MEVEEPPAEVDLVARHEQAHAPQRLGRPGAPLAGIDPAQLELSRIVAADADAEREPPGASMRDRGQLARDNGRVTKGEQIDAGLHRQAGVRREQRRRLDQPVRAVAVGEADMVAHGEVIDARRDRPLRELGQPARPGDQVLLAKDDPHPDGVAGHGPDGLDLRGGGALGRRGHGCLQARRPARTRGRRRTRG